MPVKYVLYLESVQNLYNFLDSSIMKNDSYLCYVILSVIFAFILNKQLLLEAYLLSFSAAIMWRKGIGDNVTSSVDELFKSGGKSQFEKLIKNGDDAILRVSRQQFN